MKICAKSMSGKASTRLRPTREKRKNGIGDFRARPTAASSSRVARRTPARLPNVVSSVLPPPRADAGHVIQLRSQIAHRARLAVERDREAVRLVADALHQQQRRIVRRQRDRIARVARVTAALPSSRCRPRRGSRGRALRARRRPPTAAPCRRRSRSGRETARPARAACDSAAARLRASRRSRRCTAGSRDSRPRCRGRLGIGAVLELGVRSAADPRMRNFRYSPRRIRPSSHTTIDATVSLPWIVEMSKHSMRRGSAGSAEHALQRLERVVLRRRRLVEPRLVRERGVAVRELHEPALLAALRDDDAHASAGARPTATLRAPRARPARPARESPAARRAARRTAASPLRALRLRARPTIGVASAPELDALDDAAAADLEHLDDDAGRAALQAEHVAVAELGRRHLLLPIVQRLHGARSRRAAAPPPRTARRRRPRPSAPAAFLTSSSFRPSRNSRVCFDRAAVLLRRADRVDARRDAALDVVFEARAAALAGDHLVARPDAEQPVRQRHRLARELRRQERARRRSCRRARRGARPARAETPRSSSAAGTGSSCRRAAGCCISALRCLIRLFSSASASTTESVTITSSRATSSSSASVFGSRAVGAEVVADAVAQRARLADVDRVAGRVEVQIHPRLLRQPGDLLLEFLDGHTLLCRVSCASEPSIIPCRTHHPHRDLHRRHRRGLHVPAARDHPRSAWRCGSTRTR